MGFRWVVPAALVVVGLVHLLPLWGVLGSERLTRLYGVVLDDPNLVLLMRHRAVLFGLLGAFSVSAAWLPRWHAPALGAGLVSVVSFLVLALLTPDIGARVQRVVVADAVALLCLLVAASVHAVQRRSLP